MDPVESAKLAGLRYVSDSQAGITRRRTGRWFSYRGLDGERVGLGAVHGPHVDELRHPRIGLRDEHRLGNHVQGESESVLAHTVRGAL